MAVTGHMLQWAPIGISVVHDIMWLFRFCMISTYLHQQWLKLPMDLESLTGSGGKGCMFTYSCDTFTTTSCTCMYSISFTFLQSACIRINEWEYIIQ